LDFVKAFIDLLIPQDELDIAACLDIGNPFNEFFHVIGGNLSFPAIDGRFAGVVGGNRLLAII
jgi:hypothetical protein